jgi:hypothetical protein
LLLAASSGWSLPAAAADEPVPVAEPASGGADRPSPTASDLPPGPIKRAILDLRKAVDAAGQAPDLIAKPLREAVRAADRSSGARAAGDTPHAGLLMRLANQWVAAGEAVLQAVKVEREANQAAKTARDLSTKLQRAEALLTEQQARLGRLRSEVKKAQASVDAAKSSAAGAEKKRIDDKRPKKKGAAKKGAKP